MYNSQFLTRRQPSRGLFGGFGRNSLSSWFGRGRDIDMLGYRSRHSRFGYASDCDLCYEDPFTKEHMCDCKSRLQTAQLEIEEYVAMTGMSISQGCGCPQCPFDRHGYGFYGGGGYSPRRGLSHDGYCHAGYGHVGYGHGGYSHGSDGFSSGLWGRGSSFLPFGLGSRRQGRHGGLSGMDGGMGGGFRGSLRGLF